MAITRTGRSNGGAKGRRGRRKLNSEINVTPLVDVMLVLMLIFMISASVMPFAVPIDLPKTVAKALPTQSNPVTITVDKDGKVFLLETEVTLLELAPKLSALAGENYKERIFLRGDKNGNVGTFMEVMASINAAGYSNIGLVTDPLPK